MPQTIITLPAGHILQPPAVAEPTTLKEPLDIPLPFLKVGLLGRAGAGKSHLAATFPKPMLVMASDPIEKLQSYLDCGLARDPVLGQFGQTILVIDAAKDGPKWNPYKKGSPIIQLESFDEVDPTKPAAMSQFESRCEQIIADVPRLGISTLVTDSWSGFEDLAVWRRRFGPMAVKDADAHGRDRGAAKDDIWPIFRSRLFKVACNSVFVFHTTEKPQGGEGGGASIYGIKAIGQLPMDLSRTLPERWRCEAQPDGTSRLTYTRPDGRFDLTTLIDAPSPCANTYTAFWPNYINRRAAMLLAAPTTAA